MSMDGRHLYSIAPTTLWLLICLVVAGCSLRAGRFVLTSSHIGNVKVYPWRVGVVIDKGFTPYKMTFRWWSSTPFTWSLDGLPDAFVETLRPHFLSVEPFQHSPGSPDGDYDVIAKMSVNRLHFDGANTTDREDRVDLTMTFSIHRPDATEVLRTTLSSSGTSPYKQPCMTGLCHPDPREAFEEDPRCLTNPSVSLATCHRIIVFRWLRRRD